MSVVEQAAKLYAEWQQAYADMTNECDDYEIGVAFRREDAAFERLVDFVEENDLNYSKWDPRGPAETEG